MADGTVSAPAFQRIANGIRKVERIVVDGSDAPPAQEPLAQAFGPTSFRIVGAMASGYIRIESVYIDPSGVVQVFDDGYGSAVFNSDKTKHIGAKMLTEAQAVADVGGEPAHVIPQIIGFFPVLLALDSTTPDPGSGDANAYSGSSTTAPSFKYTVKRLDGAVLQGSGAPSGCLTTTLLPEWRPQSKGKHLSGDGKVGMAYFADDGVLKLYSASETIDAEAC